MPPLKTEPLNLPNTGGPFHSNGRLDFVSIFAGITYAHNRDKKGLVKAPVTQNPKALIKP